MARRPRLTLRELSYRAHLSAYKAQCEGAGINGVHGLRHQCVQSRYEAETGWKCPAAGEARRTQLTGEQCPVDARVRMEISLALGPSRLKTGATYLGS